MAKNNRKLQAGQVDEGKKVSTGITIDSELKRSGERLARQDGRSFSGFVSFLIRRYLDENTMAETDSMTDKTEGSGLL